MDFNQFSLEDLQAMKSGNFEGMSLQGLQALKGMSGQQQPAAPQQRPPSGIAQGVVDFGKGAWHGLTAPARGARQLYNYATGDEETLKRLQREEEEADKALSGAGQVGNLVGQVGGAFIPFAGQIGKAAQVGAKGAQLATRAIPTTIKGAAGSAGIGAAMQPLQAKEGEERVGSSFGTEKLKQGAIGAVLGGGAAGAAKLFEPASAAVRQASKDLGGMATPGQLMQAGNRLWGHAGEVERRLGQYLPGSGITSSRDAAHEAAVRSMLAKEAEKAGVDVSKAGNFKDMFQATQKGKKEGYGDVVPQLSFGPTVDRAHRVAGVSFRRHTDDLTDPVRQDVASALAQSGLSQLKGKTRKGAYEGQNAQDVLSSLNKQIADRFAHNATRMDNAAGEALVKIRDDMLKQLEKHSPAEAIERYKALNRLHQMTGSDIQTKQGVFGRAKGYTNAQERGTPTLREVNQAASAGRQTKARNEVAEEAARLEGITGRHSTASQGEMAKLFTMLKGAPATIGSFGTSVVLPRTIYNPATIKMINKLAQEGNPEAQKILVMMGQTGAQGQ